MSVKKKGYRFGLVGKEIMEGSELSNIKSTRKDGSETFHFIDKRSGRELKIIQNIRRGDIDFAYETIKSDFRKVKSLEIPFCLETRVDGNTIRKIILKKVELNVLIDDSIFKVSSKKKEELYFTHNFIQFFNKKVNISFLSTEISNACS